VRELGKGALPWPLTLWGPPGTGKTCIGLSMLDRVEIIQPKDPRGEPVCGLFYWAASDYHRTVLDVQMGRCDCSRADLVRATNRAALIVLDEIDRSTDATDNRVETILDLIDRREGKPLVVISNGSPDTLGRIYGKRLPSRLSLGTIVKVDGVDRRADAGKEKAG
jgi:Cdc6-like AAA superfamily ATPase